MKGLYFLEERFEKDSGVGKKIEAQIKSIKKLGIDIELLINNREKRMVERIINKNSLGKFAKKGFGRLKGYKAIINYLVKNNFDFIYIRYTGYGDMYFYNFLLKLKKNNIKIYLEIPTFPYDNELKRNTFKEKIQVLLEKYYRNKMKDIVNKVITYSEDDTIFEIPTIKIQNGVDLDKIELVKKSESEDIRIITVAKIANWHGMDRFILSMAEYYKKNPQQKVIFNIVGYGDKEYIEMLKRLVKESELDDYVIFHGAKFGKDLDEIYNISDVAVGAIASFRQGLNSGSALKHREYTAKGIPFINGDIDFSFSNCPFVYQIPNDESLLDIEKIIEWYKNLKVTPEEIRKYAEDNLTWDKQMKKVIDNI